MSEALHDVLEIEREYGGRFFYRDDLTLRIAYVCKPDEPAAVTAERKDRLVAVMREACASRAFTIAMRPYPPYAGMGVCERCLRAQDEGRGGTCDLCSITAARAT